MASYRAIHPATDVRDTFDIILYLGYPPAYMRKTLFYTLVLLTCCLSGAFGQRAHTDSSRAAKSYWGTFGFGGSSVGPLGMLTASSGIGHHYVFSAVAETEVNHFWSTETNNLDVTRYNVLFGKIFRQQYTFLTLSAGVGTVNFTTYDRVNDNTSKYTSNKDAFEVPVMVQYYVLMSKTVSFGIQGFVDFNRIRTTEGFSLNFAFGRMRTRDGKIAQPPHFPGWRPPDPPHHGSF